MKFVLGIIAAMGVLMAVNLAMISADIQEGNVLDFTKDRAVLNMEKSSMSTQVLAKTTDEPESMKQDEAKVMDAKMHEITMEEKIIVIEEKAMVSQLEEQKVSIEDSASMQVDKTESSGVMSIDVMLAIGSGVPGCEENNECFLPADVSVAIGGTVNWINDDVGHTVTAGDVKKDPNSIGTKYPNGFDSGFFLAGNTFSHTFEEAGNYPYFCIVHPWMTGTVTVS